MAQNNFEKKKLPFREDSISQIKDFKKILPGFIFANFPRIEIDFF